MEQTVVEYGPKPPPHKEFLVLKGITAVAAHASDYQIENVKENTKLNFPMLNTLPEFNKVKGKAKPVALVGGGPTIKETYKELKNYRTIFSCGSVNDFLMEMGIVPTYSVNCDPDPVCKNYFTKKDTEVKYLISTNSSPTLMKDFKLEHQVIQWHCHSEEQYEEIVKIDEARGITEYSGIGGGCTVGLRTISIAVMLGYSNLHFFGFDSCMGETPDIHHAYEYSTPEEAAPNDKIYKIKLGDKNGPRGDKYYLVCGYQLAQLENFKDFYSRYHEFFFPTFHGGGALSAYFDIIKPDIDRQVAELKAKESKQ